jgi:hypothetical protein
MTPSTDQRFAAAAGIVSPRAPDFFIVGNPKSGTTALYEMLRLHPQIYMSDLKEPWFFATDMRARFQPSRSGSVPQTLTDYLALFEGATPGQLIGEATSSYFFSHTAASAIAALRPDARIVVILREPVSFLRSLHIQLLQDHIETVKSFGEAVALESERREGRKIPRRSHIPQLLLYSEHVRYVEHLARYRAVFPMEQMLVLIYDDFRRDNEATLRNVQQFLGVDEQLPLEVTEANRTDVRMRSQQLDELVNMVVVGRGPMSRTVKAGVKALTPRALRGGMLRATRRHLVYRKPDPPDERLTLALRRRFKGEVVALGEYLDRDLVMLWGYDRID